MKTLTLPRLTLLLALSGATYSCTVIGEATPQSAEQTYSTVCYACHDAGLWNAPMFGDTAAWRARLAQEGSIDGLLAVAKHGKGHMPARGGRSDLDDAELKAVITYMLRQSKVIS